MQVYAHQVFYDEKSRGQLDRGFIPLDNSANQRPDWYEYWPIRRWLNEHTALEDESLYGFFSPRFKEKTDLTAKQVSDFAKAHRKSCDVLIFTPPHEVHALFWNVFEQGDQYHPGLGPAAQRFLDLIGMKLALPDIVNDSRTMVFANYFLAKPRFWRRWFALTEQLYAMAEDPSHVLHSTLTKQMPHRPGNPIVELKVFIIERMASLILGSTAEFKSATHQSDIMLGSNPVEAIACDALKTAFLTQGHPAFRNAFFHIRNGVLSKTSLR
jgi:hypothetical protein